MEGIIQIADAFQILVQKLIFLQLSLKKFNYYL